MNAIKRILGLVWMALAPIAVFFMVKEAFIANNKAVEKMAKAADEAAKTAAYYAKINTNLQWLVICTVFIPIMVGFFIFGWYALRNEYEHLPESSAEVEDESVI